MRKANLYLCFLFISLVLLGLVFTHAALKKQGEMSRLLEMGKLVQRLELTDICVFTEASYTRHLSQADLHTPFQDSPLSFEHFPSGSLFPPPEMIRKRNG